MNVRFHRWGGAASRVVVLIAAMTAQSVSAETASGGRHCPKVLPLGSKVLHIDPATTGACFKFRDKDNGVMEITDAMRFATDCPVPIQFVKKVIPNDPCENVDAALARNDLLHIEDWGNDELYVTLQRPGEKDLLLNRQRLHPVTVEDQLGNSYVVGYGIDATVAGIAVKYRFHLAYVARRYFIEKYYLVDVFGKDAGSPPGACHANLPEQPDVLEMVPCDTLELTIDGPGQLPSGGGGEPPPRPKP